MSRYTATLENGNELAWGFDRPIGEYFIQLFDPEDEPIFSVGSHVTLTPHPVYPHRKHWSNGELLQVFEDYNDAIPEDHIQSLALDLVF